MKNVKDLKTTRVQRIKRVGTARTKSFFNDLKKFISLPCVTREQRKMYFQTDRKCIIKGYFNY